MNAVHNVEGHNWNSHLLRVVGTIFVLYVVILTTGYFVGNMIYQIP